MTSSYALGCWNALVPFEAAARNLSFTKAAKELCVTQGAISRQIKRLEDSLGVALFRGARRPGQSPSSDVGRRRNGTSLALTPAGQSFYQQVRVALDAIELGVQQLEANETPAFLTLTTLWTLGMKWLIPRIPELQQQHPDIDLRISTSERLVDLQQAQVDVALRYGTGDWPGVHSELLMHEHMIAVCTPDFLRAHGQLRFDRLDGKALLHNVERAGAWNSWLRSAGASADTLSAAQPSKGRGLRHFFMTLEAARQHLGIAIVPEFIVADDVRQGIFVLAHPHREPSAKSYYLAYPERSRTREDFHTLRTWLKEQAAAATL